MGLFDMFKRRMPHRPSGCAGSGCSWCFCQDGRYPGRGVCTGILGQGCGIDPSEGKVYAPCDGEITQAPDTLHAFGITTPGGVEVLIHVGVDTVEMKGDGLNPRSSWAAKSPRVSCC